MKGLPGFEPGSRDSESPVLTITPQALKNYLYLILRQPGIEPGPRAWEARILAIELLALYF